MPLAATSIDTPLAAMRCSPASRVLVQLQPADAPAAPARGPARSPPRSCSSALRARSRAISRAWPALAALPLDLRTAARFQRRVWAALREIPLRGDRELWRDRAARRTPARARAVGDANRRNPIAIAIPCHRVIGGERRLVGYAGGLARKRWLLDHEARCAAHRAPASGRVVERT
jgi:methylated-DNA-[protein]-cysteine S-methyltransferase